MIQSPFGIAIIEIRTLHLYFKACTNVTLLSMCSASCFVGWGQEAHTNGIACLVSCPQEDAERYCEGLRMNGLISTIEPAGGRGGGGPEAD
jgi:hypothetical protein